MPTLVPTPPTHQTFNFPGFYIRFKNLIRWDNQYWNAVSYDQEIICQFSLHGTWSQDWIQYKKKYDMIWCCFQKNNWDWLVIRMRILFYWRSSVKNKCPSRKVWSVQNLAPLNWWKQNITLQNPGSLRPLRTVRASFPAYGSGTFEALPEKGNPAVVIRFFYQKCSKLFAFFC